MLKRHVVESSVGWIGNDDDLKLRSERGSKVLQESARPVHTRK
jgi:hypothetical protein